MTWQLPAHAPAVMALFGFPDGADVHHTLWWRSEPDGSIGLYAVCNDVFHWATADLEPIGPHDVGLLERCLADLQAVGEPWLLAELFAARKRHMRPMRLWLGIGAHRKEPLRSLDLFTACGPERRAESEL